MIVKQAVDGDGGNGARGGVVEGLSLFVVQLLHYLSYSIINCDNAKSTDGVVSFDLHFL